MSSLLKNNLTVHTLHADTTIIQQPTK